MKNIKYLLLLLLFIPIIAFAKDNVEIESITLLEKSEYVSELENATYDNLKLDFKLKFVNKDDYAKYKVILKNNSDKDYEVDNQTTFNEGNFVKYEFNVDNDLKILKANEELVIYVKISYIKEVDSNSFVNGKYVDNNTVSLELSNFDEIDENENIKFVVNPNTDTGYMIAIVLILILSILIIILIKNRKTKRYITMLILLLIPLYVYAIERIRLDVDAYVEIVKKNKFELLFYFCDAPEESYEYEYEYEDGMTFNDFLNSSYFNKLVKDEKDNINRLLDDNLLVYYTHDYNVCVNDIEEQYTNGEITSRVFGESLTNCFNLYAIRNISIRDKIKDKYNGSYGNIVTCTALN